MNRVSLPKPESRTYALLQALMAGPGTFYQIAERAGFDLEAPGVEGCLRMIFSRSIPAHARMDGIKYVLKEATRHAMLGIDSVRAGQVATPHFRGTTHAMPVLIVRRSGKSSSSTTQQST